MMQAECGRIAARPVVIAAYRNPAKFSGQINHFVGICTITDNIAEIPYHVVFRRRGKNSLKSWEIRVDVGYDKRTHLSLSFALSLYFAPPGPGWDFALSTARFDFLPGTWDEPTTGSGKAER